MAAGAVSLQQRRDFFVEQSVVRGRASRLSEAQTRDGDKGKGSRKQYTHGAPWLSLNAKMSPACPRWFNWNYTLPVLVNSDRIGSCWSLRIFAPVLLLSQMKPVTLPVGNPIEV